MPGDGVLNAFERMAKEMVKEKIRPHISKIFEDYGAEDLQMYILTDYKMVEKELPDEVKEKVEEYGSEYPDMIARHITPENVLYWLSNPEWARDDEVAKNLEELAETIKTTPGGKEWLAMQVHELWELAGVTENDPES